MASKSVSVVIFGALALRGLSTSLKLLGRDSLPSLQSSDGGGLVAVVIFDDLGALSKASKVQDLVQLDCKLVNLKFVDLGLRKDHLELDGNDLSEGFTGRPSEGQVDLVDYAITGLNAGDDRQWN